MEGDDLRYRVRKTLYETVDDTDDEHQGGPTVVFGQWRHVLFTQEERDTAITKVHSEGNVYTARLQKMIQSENIVFNHQFSKQLIRN